MRFTNYDRASFCHLVGGMSFFFFFLFFLLSMFQLRQLIYMMQATPFGKPAVSANDLLVDCTDHNYDIDVASPGFGERPQVPHMEFSIVRKTQKRCVLVQK